MLVMVMYDATPETARALGEELGLTFPILSDPSYELFNRWNETHATPSSTIIDRGAVVAETETVWYPAQLEGYVYGEEQ